MASSSVDRVIADTKPEDIQHSEEQEEPSENANRPVSGSRPVAEYQKYLYLFSEHMHDDIDILILSSDDENDFDEINRLKKEIKQTFTIENQLFKPRVQIYTKITDLSPDQLGNAYNRSLYIFVYVPGKCNMQALLDSNACLKASLDDKDKRWAVIPVYDSPKQSQQNNLVFSFQGLKPLLRSRKSFVEDVQNLLKSKFGVIIQKRMELHEERTKYLNKNRDTLIKKYEFSQRNSQKAGYFSPNTTEIASLAHGVEKMSMAAQSDSIHQSTPTGNVSNTGMDQVHRDLIRVNHRLLVEGIHTLVDDVVDHVWAAGIISGAMKNIILEKQGTRTKVKAFLDIIVERGANAFEALYKAVIDAELYPVADILKPDNKPHDKNTPENAEGISDDQRSNAKQ